VKLKYTEVIFLSNYNKFLNSEKWLIINSAPAIAIAKKDSMIVNAIAQPSYLISSSFFTKYETIISIPRNISINGHKHRPANKSQGFI